MTKERAMKIIRDATALAKLVVQDIPDAQWMKRGVVHTEFNVGPGPTPESVVITITCSRGKVGPSA